MHIQSWKEAQTFSEERFTKKVLFSDKNHTIFVTGITCPSPSWKGCLPSRTARTW